MTQLIDNFFNLTRMVALGAAVAFLVMPYTNIPVYAHDDPRDSPGDMDGDQIENKTDVCIEAAHPRRCRVRIHEGNRVSPPWL